MSPETCRAVLKRLINEKLLHLVGYLHRCTTLNKFLRTTRALLLNTCICRNAEKETCSVRARKLSISDMFFSQKVLMSPISMAAPSKAQVCGRCLGGTAGSNTAGAWMSASCDSCVLSDTGVYIGLITRPEEPYRVWCVLSMIMCNKNPLHLQCLGRRGHRKQDR